MSYTKQTWQSGDKVTSAKLNHMEDGIAGAVKVVPYTNENDSITLGMTWQEIHDALEGGEVLVVPMTSEFGSVCGLVVSAMITNSGDDTVYVVYLVNGNGFETDSANGYPGN